MRSVLIHSVITMLLISLFCIPHARAGQFSVAPIRLEFARTVKTGVITVTNDGDAPIDFQMKAMEWNQDGEGKDVYSETKDIVFYPKLMTLGKKESRIIRVGYNGPRGQQERTYRLYIEELPGRSGKKGANVAIAIRFGVPLFIKSVNEQSEAAITRMILAEAKASIEVANSGNTHVKIDSVAFTGKDAGGVTVYEQDVSGWYLLPGAKRVYETGIPAEKCAKMASLTAAIRSNTVQASRDLIVTSGMCRE